jgi:Family of unknown function (DUF6206)
LTRPSTTGAEGAAAARPVAAGLPDDALLRLDEQVEAALGAGDESALPILGYGEISLVLGWPPEQPRFACKRLPVFATRSGFNAYWRTLDAYLDALRQAGIRAVQTELRPVTRDDGTVAGYVVQPVLPAEDLAPAILAHEDPYPGHPLVAALVGTVADAVSPTVGLDAQLSNWTWDGSGLTYLDVSTPLLWSDEGRPLLDLDLLSRAIPWALRGALRRLVIPGIVETYRDLHKVYLDLCGNLIKERLDRWLPVFLEQVARRLDTPLTAGEVHRYYRSDARLWAVLLRIRRLDRVWQLRVRRRPYPFLLPGEIER